jgi:hypothetical protein
MSEGTHKAAVLFWGSLRIKKRQDRAPLQIHPYTISKEKWGQIPLRGGVPVGWGGFRINPQPLKTVACGGDFPVTLLIPLLQA